MWRWHTQMYRILNLLDTDFLLSISLFYLCTLTHPGLFFWRQDLEQHSLENVSGIIAAEWTEHKSELQIWRIKVWGQSVGPERLKHLLCFAAYLDGEWRVGLGEHRKCVWYRQGSVSCFDTEKTGEKQRIYLFTEALRFQVTLHIRL